MYARNYCTLLGTHIQQRRSCSSGLTFIPVPSLKSTLFLLAQFRPLEEHKKIQSRLPIRIPLSGASSPSRFQPSRTTAKQSEGTNSGRP
jgi:hypothetical protein